MTASKDKTRPVKIEAPPASPADEEKAYLRRALNNVTRIVSMFAELQEDEQALVLRKLEKKRTAGPLRGDPSTPMLREVRIPIAPGQSRSDAIAAAAGTLPVEPNLGGVDAPAIEEGGAAEPQGDPDASAGGGSPSTSGPQ